MDLHHSKTRLMLCTALALIASVGAANAQTAQAAATNAADNGNVTELQQIVVKGKRAQAASTASDTPLATQTSADEIRKSEIRNMQDLGNTTEPGVEFVESRPGAAGGTFIRGLGGARIATLVDDIPVPYLETLTRSGSASPTTGISDSTNAFDFEALSAVDILRGSDSSRVGSGALGGAIVMRTLEPEDLIGEGKDWGGVAKTGYDGQDRSFNGSLAVAKRIEQTSILFQAGYKRGHETKNQGTSDITGSSRTLPNPLDSTQSNFMVKVRQELEGGHRIGFTAERFSLEKDVDLLTLVNGTSYRAGFYDGFDDTRRERLSVDYNYLAPSADSFVTSANLTAYWQRLIKDSGSNATRFSTSGAPTSWAYDRENETSESSFGLTGSALKEIDAGSVKHNIRLGGNVNFFNYDQMVTSIGGTSATSSNTSQQDVPNVDGVRLGLYLDDRIEFAETGFALTPGVRLDWYQYSPTNADAFQNNTGYNYFGMPDKKNGFRLSPKLLATYQATDHLELFAQWSMSYRAPTLTELYSNFTNVAGGYGVVGNEDLKDEIGNGFELGASYNEGGFSGKVTAFHNQYKNFINETVSYTSQYPAGYFSQFMINSWENLDRVQISGVEVKARKDFDNGIFIHGSLSYAYGKDKATGDFIRTVAPFKSIVGVGYAQEQWGAEVTGVFAAGMRDDNTANTFDAPGYGLFNLTGWWEPEQTKGLRIQAGIYNVFDKTYYNAVGVRDINPNSASSTNQPVAFYSEPGRTFKISLTQKF